ncbi:prolyl endopeptidase-like isoform X2 [Ctenopharyngodon idella]|uniref:prolyl endopeptidase-like isoform X2 n=1 Tax=Ctenopharyngodon idella TaxID=7959 RepID=UPI0022313FCC|nr:prolyl endopeptidase-like isoform X2 [Ctenopharyngodon idella]
MNLTTSSCLLLLRSVSRNIHRANIHPLISRLYTEGFSQTTAELSKAQPQKLRVQEQRFKRRLHSIHRKFANVPENSEFQGHHHVYFEDGKGIYRSTMGHGEQEMVEVFRADWGGDGYGSIQRVRLSPTETMLAATVNKDHHEETRCVLVHLGGVNHHQNAMLVLDNVLSFEWAADDVLFYSTQEALRCLHVFRLHLSDSGVQTTLVYEEKDPEFFVEVSCSRDQRLVTINCSSKISSEVWFVDSKTPLSFPTLIQSRQPGLLYHVEHSDNHLFILANTGAHQEYQLLRAPLASPSMPHWVPVFSAVPGTVIKDMELLQDHCVFTVKDSQCRLQIQTLTTQEPYQLNTLQLPHWACDLSPQRVGTVDRGSFGFLLSSPVHPPVRYLYSSRKQKLSITEDDARYISLPEFNTTHLQAASQDGTMVPLTLLHMPALSELHNAPLLLHVYGAYGVDLNMSFSPEKRLLLEDGWALAYCHVRGGGERGLAWHRAGSVLQKWRGVEDLAACIQTLHRLGVSHPALTALTARSAGAVLAGALCNHNPQLLRAVILQAPFLDVLGTMQDASLPLTVEERGEWGDPLIREHRDNIASYCPCHNIIPQLYPSILITAYSEDRRVPLSGVMKYVERLKKAIQICTTRVGVNARVPAVILDMQPGGDHFGPEDFHLSLNESARQLAFLYTELGLDHQKTRRRQKKKLR